MRLEIFLSPGSKYDFLHFVASRTERFELQFGVGHLSLFLGDKKEFFRICSLSEEEPFLRQSFQIHSRKSVLILERISVENEGRNIDQG